MFKQVVFLRFRDKSCQVLGKHSRAVLIAGACEQAYLTNVYDETARVQPGGVQVT